MSDDCAFEHLPTLSERAWKALGFRYHHGEEPEGSENLEGWMCTDTRMHFGFLDRLRLLLTGRLRFRIVHHMPVTVDYSLNRIDWQIEPFGGQ